MAGQLWVRLMRKNKMVRDTVAHCPQGEDWRAALTAACHQMDLPVPVQVPGHERDWAEYRQTRFRRSTSWRQCPLTAWRLSSLTRTAALPRAGHRDPRNG